MSDDSIKPQAIPDETACPYCGAPPTDESTVEHNLSACGYLHDDIKLECRDCGESWMCGVPVGGHADGDSDAVPDLFCASCDHHRLLVHRVELVTAPTSDAIPDDISTLVQLHLKCPSCNWFTTTVRAPDRSGVALVGYPSITGDLEDAAASGYPTSDLRPDTIDITLPDGTNPRPDADD